MQTAFKPFSPKQKLALRWWALPQYRDYDAIICDGAVRSGKPSVCRWDLSVGQPLAFKAQPLHSAEKPLLPYGEMW